MQTTKCNVTCVAFLTWCWPSNRHRRAKRLMWRSLHRVCELQRGPKQPQSGGACWGGTLTAAALFGFFTYMTYDLSNLATLRDWPVAMSLLDIAWGTGVSAVAAAGGKVALEWASRS